MISLWVICVLLCVLMGLVVRARLKKSHGYKLPPIHYGDRPFVGITHLFLCNSARLWDLMRKTSEYTLENGGVTVSKIGLDSYYFVTDVDDAINLFNSCLKKHFIYEFAKSVFGDGLLTGAVPIWQRHRKLMNPAFSLPIINGYLEVFNTQNKKMVDEMAAYADKGLFDPTDLIKNTIMTVSCLNVFGTSNMREEGILKKYMFAVDGLLRTYTQRFQKFWLHNDLLYKLCGVKKVEKSFVDEIQNLSHVIIQTKKNAARNGLEPTNDLNYRPLIDIIEPLTSNNTFTIQELKEELDTTIGAAYETTTNTLQVALLLLGSYPEVQEQVFQELIKVLGPERDVEKEDVPKLPYTDAVLKETLRYLPIAPVLLRYVDRDVQLKNYTVPAGSYCCMLPYGIHRNKETWGEDAWSFKPERWLNPDTLPNHPGAFTGFSAGKRNCIGKTYAITALKVSLAHLVRRYKFQADFNKVQFKLEITLKPEIGHEISIQKRDKILIE